MGQLNALHLTWPALPLLASPGLACPSSTVGSWVPAAAAGGEAPRAARRRRAHTQNRKETSATRRMAPRMVHATIAAGRAGARSSVSLWDHWRRPPREPRAGGDRLRVPGVHPRHVHILCVRMHPACCSKGVRAGSPSTWGPYCPAPHPDVPGLTRFAPARLLLTSWRRCLVKEAAPDPAAQELG